MPNVMLKIKLWAKAHDVTDVEAWVTVTRCIDPANNSNKYRRFISVWAPNERPYVFTHTGRWTTECDQGRWNNVGTYRPGSLCNNTSWRRQLANNQQNISLAHESFHDAYVQQKLGEYQITEPRRSVNPQNANFWDWMHKADVIDTGAPTPVPNPSTPPTAPTPASPPPAPLDTGAALLSRVQRTLQRATHDGTDPFDVLAEVTSLRKEVASALNELQDMQGDLLLANEKAMERI